MAQITTLEGLRSQVLDSVKGRKLGLDNKGFLVGIPNVRPPVNSISTVTGTINSYGYTTLALTTAAPTYSLDVPSPGSEIGLMIGTTILSTFSYTINASTGAFFQTTAGATFQTITISSATASYVGATLTLVAKTTALWQVIAPFATCMVAS